MAQELNQCGSNAEPLGLLFKNRPRLTSKDRSPTKSNNPPARLFQWEEKEGRDCLHGGFQCIVLVDLGGGYPFWVVPDVGVCLFDLFQCLFLGNDDNDAGLLFCWPLWWHFAF